MKSYPKTKFEIIDKSQIQEINTSVVTGPTIIMMQTYTSDKGSEDWEIMQGLDDFIKAHGTISFKRHGQSLLTVAEILRAGGAVFGKRMVADDATLANLTIRMRIVPVDGVSYVYIYGLTSEDVKSINEASKAGYKDFDPDNPGVEGGTEGTVDVPLFTVTAAGRGICNLRFRLNPEYGTSRRSTTYMRYSFEVYEGTELVESILFTMNPNIVVDGISQAMNPKIKYGSKQVKVKFYDDAVPVVVNTLAQTATDENGEPIPAQELIDLDWLYGYDRKGKKPIGNIVFAAQSTASGTDFWTTNKPSDIGNTIDLHSGDGIRLTNGTNGALDVSPMEHPAEYEQLLLGAWGADQDSIQFDPIIYDLDAWKIDAIFDCDYPLSVKKAIANVVDFRGDCQFFMDMGKTLKDYDSIVEQSMEMPVSRACNIYHNWFNIYDPYTKREITVTMTYLLAIRMVGHLAGGVIRPFAGIKYGITFPEIIEGTINFVPREIPGLNQKQTFADNCINYISYYDGLPVMETEYTNQNDYTQLSFSNNMMAIQEIIKAVRTECPKIRYSFLDGDDLDKYLDDVNEVLARYKSNYKELTCQYMADEKYELNKIFYATITVKFRDFVQEEYFKLTAIN